MSATSSFIAGLIAGAAAPLLSILLLRSPSVTMRRSRQLMLAGGLAAAAVALASLGFTLESRPGSAAASGGPDTTGAPPSAASPSATSAPADMPSAAVMSQILATPRSARTQSAAPMDEAAAGLAARLQRQGGTAEDWNLLAQAYDFLGRPEDARRARVRAAEAAVQRNP